MLVDNFMDNDVFSCINLLEEEEKERDLREYKELTKLSENYVYNVPEMTEQQRNFRFRREKVTHKRIKECISKDITLYLIDPKTHMNKLEMFCQLYDSAAEIKALRDLGFSVLQKNKTLNKYPIHFAIESWDTQNINAVVKNVNINQLYDGKSVFHLIIEKMDNDNFYYLFNAFANILQLRFQPEINFKSLLRGENNIIGQLLKKDSTRLSAENQRKLVRHLLGKEQFKLFLSGQLRDQIVSFFPDIAIPTEIELACIIGDYEKLKALLPAFVRNREMQQQPPPLLAIVVKNMCSAKNKHNPAYKSCFNTLLKSSAIYRLIDVPDDKNNSALHYATERQAVDVVKCLLNVSIYCGSNLTTKYAISKVNPKVIEEHLDSCITRNEKHDSHQDYMVNINYTSFNPIGNSIMSLFHFITLKSELQYLLQHPTIESFLYFRWLKFNFWFNIRLFVNAIYFIYCITYFTFCNGNKTGYCIPEWFFIIAWIFFFIVLFNNLSNFPFLNLIFISFLYPRHFYFSENYFIYSCCILLSAVEMLYCLKGAQFMCLSKYFYLFQRVLKNFAKMLLFYGICIVAFAFVFYKNHIDQRLVLLSGDNITDVTTSIGFGTPSMAILKTLIMSTGEYDASDFEIQDDYLFCIVFPLFIIAIVIVLSNLLIGLAVNDTQDIMNRADMENLIFRVQIMYHNERILAIFKRLLNLKYVVHITEIKHYIILYPNRKYSYEGEQDITCRILRYLKKKLYQLSFNTFELKHNIMTIKEFQTPKFHCTMPLYESTKAPTAATLLISSVCVEEDHQAQADNWGKCNPERHIVLAGSPNARPSQLKSSRFRKMLKCLKALCSTSPLKAASKKTRSKHIKSTEEIRMILKKAQIIMGQNETKKCEYRQNKLMQKLINNS